MSDFLTSGFGILCILTVVSIALKLAGKLALSWAWVLVPLWINIILSIVAVVMFAILARNYRAYINYRMAKQNLEREV